MGVRLDSVHWPAALDALERRHTTEASPHSRRLLADAYSLSSLFENDFRAAVDRVDAASRLEPINPLHSVRRALLHLRFGDTEGAVRALPGEARDLPHILQVRALIALRMGDALRARTLATDLLEVAGGHAAARFMAAEAQSHVAMKGFRARAESAPRSADRAALWADLLAKVALSEAGEGPKVSRSLASVLPAGSAPAERLNHVLAWVSADADALANALAVTATGSRSEQVVLLCLSDALQSSGDATVRLMRLRSLWRTHPERTAVRRLYVSAMTQQAISEAGAERYGAALRIVEACLELEPHEPIHYQNRAALFTALLDDHAYHTGWAELERHHYRLALAGRFDRSAARKMLRPHRMFAQHARRSHLFTVEVDRERSGEIQVVNQSGIDSDPEQLRQWIHHRRAEVVFLHCAVGARSEQLLLYPDSATVARQRAEGLVQAAGSLGVLVPEEGAHLAVALRSRWEKAAATCSLRYADWPEDEEARALAIAHLETLGDLAMLATQWAPGPSSAGVVDELLDFLKSEGPFFDDGVLFREVGERDRRATQSIRYLAAFTRSTLDLPDAVRPLSERARSKVLEHASALLLMRLALATFGARGGAPSLDAAVEILDRARKFDSESARLELTASRLLAIGEYYDEARAALARYHRLARGGRGASTEEAAEIGRLLDTKRKEGSKGRKRSANAEAEAAPQLDAVRGTARDTLEAELDRFPASIQLHEDLVRVLVLEGALQPALEWSDHAIAHCLSRDGQRRARLLNIETLGLRELAPVIGAAASLYASGSSAALLEALERLEGLESRPYTVQYLHGVALLAAKRADEARRAFIRALEGCTVQMHRAVLRPLAFDIEEALLRQLERDVDDALQDGRLERAMEELELTWPRLAHPEACLADVARVELARAVAAAGKADGERRPLVLPCSAPWGPQLRAALQQEDLLPRARDLADLAISLYEPARKKAESVRRRAEVVGAKLAMARIIDESSEFLRAGRSEAALAALDMQEGSSEPAWLRQRIVVLLSLERLDEADAENARLLAFRDGPTVEFCARYPASSCTRRIARATRLLRAGDIAGAEAALGPAEAAGAVQQLDLAYCRAFALAMRAARARESGTRAEYAEPLGAALSILEGHLALARQQRHARIIELYDRLDAEFARLEDMRA